MTITPDDKLDRECIKALLNHKEFRKRADALSGEKPKRQSQEEKDTQFLHFLDNVGVLPEMVEFLRGEINAETESLPQILAREIDGWMNWYGFTDHGDYPHTFAFLECLEAIKGINNPELVEMQGGYSNIKAIEFRDIEAHGAVLTNEEMISLVQDTAAKVDAANERNGRKNQAKNILEQLRAGRFNPDEHSEQLGAYVRNIQNTVRAAEVLLATSVVLSLTSLVHLSNIGAENIGANAELTLLNLGTIISYLSCAGLSLKNVLDRRNLPNKIGQDSGATNEVLEFAVERLRKGHESNLGYQINQAGGVNKAKGGKD